VREYVQHHLAATLNLQPVKKAAQVRPDCRCGYLKLLGDLLVAQSGKDAPDHLGLTP
jgi:hypothetical protein